MGHEEEERAAWRRYDEIKASRDSYAYAIATAVANRTDPNAASVALFQELDGRLSVIWSKLQSGDFEGVRIEWSRQP